MRAIDARALPRSAQLAARVPGFDGEALHDVPAQAPGESRIVIGRLSILRKALLRELIELAQRALDRRELILERGPLAAAEQEPKDQPGERGEGRGRAEAEQKTHDLGEERGGQVGLRLERLDVRGVLAVADDRGDAQDERCCHGNAGRAVRTEVGHFDGRHRDIADHPGGHAITERPARDAAGPARALRRQDLEDLDIADVPRDAWIADLIASLRVGDDRQDQRIAHGDRGAIDRRGRVHGVGGRGGSAHHTGQRQSHAESDLLQLRRVLALKSAMSAGTYGRSVYRSTASIFIRPRALLRSSRLRRAATAYSSRSRSSPVSTYAMRPLSASSSATTPTFGRSSSRGSLSVSAMTSCFRPSMRTAGSSPSPTSMKSLIRKTTLRFFVTLVRNRAADDSSVRARLGSAKSSSRMRRSR